MAVIAAANLPARVFVSPDALALARQKVRRMSAEIDARALAVAGTDFSPSSG